MSQRIISGLWWIGDNNITICLSIPTKVPKCMIIAENQTEILWKSDQINFNRSGGILLQKIPYKGKCTYITIQYQSQKIVLKEVPSTYSAKVIPLYTNSYSSTGDSGSIIIKVDQVWSNVVEDIVNEIMGISHSFSS